jgi:hypothetical protein
MKLFLWLLFALTASLQAADLQFEKDLTEVHVDLDAKTTTSEFKFTNGGDEPLKIRHASAGCSCLAVEFAGSKATYAPGESGVLRATFEVGNFQGTVDKEIQIWLEGDPDDKPSSKITLRVHIPEVVALEPKTLKWEVGSAPETKTMLVKMNYEKPVHVTTVETSNPNFSAKIRVIEKGKTYAIDVTPGETSLQGLSIVRIETDLEIEKYRLQQGFAVVRAPESKP